MVITAGIAAEAPGQEVMSAAQVCQGHFSNFSPLLAAALTQKIISGIEEINQPTADRRNKQLLHLK